ARCGRSALVPAAWPRAAGLRARRGQRAPAGARARRRARSLGLRTLGLRAVAVPADEPARGQGLELRTLARLGLRDAVQHEALAAVRAALVRSVRARGVSPAASPAHLDGAALRADAPLDRPQRAALSVSDARALARARRIARRVRGP